MKIPHFLTIAGKLVPLIISQGGYLVTQLADSSENIVDMPTNLATLSRVTSNPTDKIAGIYDQLFLRYQYTTTPAGAYLLTSDAVPAGYIWHVQSIFMSYTGTKTGRTFAIQMNLGALTYNIWLADSLPTNGYQSISVNFYVTAGYKLIFGVYNAELNKTVQMDLIGVRMQIPV